LHTGKLRNGVARTFVATQKEKRKKHERGTADSYQYIRAAPADN
jgi:hypothetical protein